MIPSICDLSDANIGKVQTLRPGFRHFGLLSKFHGRVTTIRCLEDNALLKSTLGTPGDGRVMVVDGGGSLERALFGDMLGALLRDNGWAGIVINGAVRDVEVVRQMPIAVRALEICPTQPNKLGTGERDVVVSFGGVTFNPGDWLYADENGVIVSTAPLT
ncbi:MAG: ribonuclease E activity regulator RraA [Gammaproteobacteria bacterium]|jgi:regulator of ribonuclease activity A